MVAIIYFCMQYAIHCHAKNAHSAIKIKRKSFEKTMGLILYLNCTASIYNVNSASVWIECGHNKINTACRLVYETDKIGRENANHKSFKVNKS